MNESLPQMFLWHKAGSESSHDFCSTLQIKDLQRANNPDGIFLWGLGSNVAKHRLLEFLDQLNDEPQVVISHINSRPRPQDVQFIDCDRKTVRVWKTATSVLTGENFPILQGSQVVSAAYNKEGEEAKRKYHYALVCQSDSPISESLLDELYLDPTAVRAFDDKKPVKGNGTLFAVEQGKPQERPASSKLHQVRLKLRLVEPYLVRLGDPEMLKNVKISSQTGKYPV